MRRTRIAYMHYTYVDRTSGDTICAACGVVASAHHISEHAEWRNFSDDPCPDKSRCMRVNPLLSMSTTSSKKLLTYRDNAVLSAQAEMNEVKGKLHDTWISVDVVDLSAQLYADLMDSRARGLRGLTIEGVRVAALHEAIRLSNMQGGPSAMLLCQQTGCSIRRFNAASKALKESQTPLMRQLRVQCDRNMLANDRGRTHCGASNDDDDSASHLAAQHGDAVTPLTARQRIKRRLEERWGGQATKKAASDCSSTCSQLQQPANKAGRSQLELLDQINLDDIPEI